MKILLIICIIALIKCSSKETTLTIMVINENIHVTKIKIYEGDWLEKNKEYSLKEGDYMDCTLEGDNVVNIHIYVQGYSYGQKTVYIAKGEDRILYVTFDFDSMVRTPILVHNILECPPMSETCRGDCEEYLD